MNFIEHWNVKVGSFSNQDDPSIEDFSIGSESIQTQMLWVLGSGVVNTNVMTSIARIERKRLER